jgi:7-carboxy-7-deazaguanine synthase
MNAQPIDKLGTPGAFIEVHSIFRTIQGEGPFCGVPATFVRLAGCNLQCPGCDTDYTSKRELFSALKLVRTVQDVKRGGLVVITGGEPFRQDLHHLLRLLVLEGFYVQVETNGTLPPPQAGYVHIPHFRKGVYVVVSPKAGKVHPLTEEAACAYKYVLAAGRVHPDDGLPTNVLDHPVRGRVARPPLDWHKPVYVQPEDAGNLHDNEKNMKAAVQSCMAHGYTLQLQVHKLLGME